MAAAAIAAPPPIVNTANPASRQGTALIISVSSAPAMMPVTTSGSSIAPNAAPRGSFESMGTMSRTGEETPAILSTTWVSSCATTGLAAEAVSSCGVLPPTMIAP